MRKMFTRLFSLALLVMLLSSVTVVNAQSDCGPTISASDVVLVTDITTVCDSDLVQYKVTGYPDALFAFNWDGDPANIGGYSPDSTFWVTEGVGFTVRVLVNDTCYSNELDFAGQDTIQQVLIDSMAAEHPMCWDDQGEVTIYFEGSHPPHTVFYVDSANWVGPAGDYSDYAYTGGTQFAAEGGWYYAAVQGVNPDCGVSEWDSIYVNPAPEQIVVTQFEASVDTLTCIGDEGTITVDVTGGVTFSDGSYIITVGDSVKTTTVPAVFNMPAGSYTVMVEDSMTCTATLDSTLVITDPDEITFDIAIVDVTCAEGDQGVIKVFDFDPAADAFEASLGDGNWVAQTGDTIFMTGLTAGYYSLYVRDVTTGCDSVGYVNPNNTQNVISVQSPEELHYTVVYNDTIICYGDSTWVTLDSLSGGSGNYEFSFDGEAWQDTAWAWYVPAGTYGVSVRDLDDASCEMPWPDPIEIDQISPVYINYVQTIEPSCPGGNDGLAKIYAYNGNGTYEYSIDGTTWYANNVFALPAGDYTAYVRDPLCPDYVYDYDFYIWDWDNNEMMIDWADTVVCQGGMSEGVEGYGYFPAAYWDGRDVSVYLTASIDDVFVTGEELNWYWDWYEEIYWYTYDLEPGTYYVWAKDSYGCIVDNDGDGEADYLTFTVHEAETPTVTATVTEEATCYGDNDGVLTMFLEGESVDEDLYYALTNTLEQAENIDMDYYGMYWDEDMDSINVQVGKGTYYVVIQDDYCTDTIRSISGPFVVDGYDELLVGDTISTTHNLCYGDENGIIEFEPATGGSGEMVYSLHEFMGDVVEGYDSVSTTTFTGLAAGWYVLEVIDLNGCDGDMSYPVVITQPADPVTFTMDSLNISCYGASDGKVYLDADGGVGGYEFKIGTAPWLAFPAGSDEKTVVITEPGTYEVWVRDADGCVSESQMVTIEEPTPVTLIAEADSVTSSCLEDPNGMISVIVDGGNTDTFMVEVIGIDTIVGYTDSLFSTMDTLPAGTYTVIATEIGDGARGCFQVEEVVIGAPSELEGVAIVVDSVHCNGSNEGVIEVTSVLGGVAPYELVLSESAVALDTITYDAEGENIFSSLEAGSYSVTVVDAEGCEFDINNLEISEPSALGLNATKIQDITCQAPGMFSIQATGGVGNYKYFAALSKLPEHILVPDPESAAWQDDSVFSVDVAGTYIVWAMDSNMCVIGGEENDLGNPVNAWRVKVAEPSIVVSFDQTIEDSIMCNGEETADLIVSNIVVTEDLLPIVDPEVTVVINGVETDTLSDVGAGVYYVTVTHDASGCSTTDSFVVTEPDALVAVLDKAEGNFTCPDAVEGYIEVTITDSSTAPFEYQLWQGDAIKTDYQEDNSFLVTIGKSYTVVVMDANGCTDTTNTLEIVPVEEIEFELTDVTCSDDTMASVLVEVTGEPGRMFQVWWQQFEVESGEYTDTSAWFMESIKLDQRFIFDNENIDDIHYAFTVVDDMGCVAGLDTMTFDQIITAPLELTVAEGEVGDCSTEVTVTAAGGVAPYTIMVNGEETSETVLMLGGGTYEISVMDAHQCMDVKEITLEYGLSADTTLETYTGEAAQLVIEEAMLDTMLYAGEYTFYYDVDTACVAELNVTVTERDRMAPVLDTVTPMDTIETNHAVFTIVFEDVVTFNDSVMGYLTVTKKDSAEATLEIPITADMVDGNTITVDYDYTVVGMLDLNTTYTVAVDSGIVMGDGLAWDGVTGAWEFTTGAEYPTDVDDLELETIEFSVYPNPFNDFIRIDNADKLDRVIVSNIAGQRILDIEYPSYEIRTGNLVTGVYVVTLISNDEIVKSERIIKR